MKNLRTPVLLITYKRLDTTLKVLEGIAKVQPEKLYIASNAPNSSKPDDTEKVAAVRLMLEEKINWPCTIKKLYRHDHLSAKDSISSAINWFFENEEEGIIMEDDILADTSFFRYCEAMLEKYRNDKQIRFVNGCNFGFKLRNKSYGFTRFMNMWGWATWKRSIDLVDFNLNEWNSLKNKEKFLSEIFEGQSAKTKQIAVKYFKQIFDNTFSSVISTWDYQCIFSNFFTKTYCIFPSKNLVRNLGFNNDGTHTNFEPYFLTDLKIEKLDFPLKDNPEMTTDVDYEKFVIERWANLKIKNRLYYSIYYRKYLLMKKIRKLLNQ